jgi:putative tryptophan/tyrosine transport system substrate-binding protein
MRLTRCLDCSLTAGTTLSEKWVQILKETFPNVVSVAVLASATSTSSAYIDRVRRAANSIGVKPRYFTTGDADGVDRALHAIAEMKPDGLIVESDTLLVSNRARIIAFAAEQRLPSVYGNLDYMPDVGLMA